MDMYNQVFCVTIKLFYIFESSKEAAFLERMDMLQIGALVLLGRLVEALGYLLYYV